MENFLPNPEYRRKLMRGTVTSGEKDKPGYLDPEQAKKATNKILRDRENEEYKNREVYDLNSTK